HLAEKVDELVAGGMSREEATFAARREFGNVLLVEERSRDVWRWPSLENLFMDLRYGLRQLRRNRGFTATAILTLALGIGMNTAVFSVVNAVLLKPLGYPHADRLVWLSDYNVGWGDNWVMPAAYALWRNESHSFESMVGYANQDLALIT